MCQPRRVYADTRSCARVLHMDTYTHMSSSQDALAAVPTPRPRPVSSLIHNTSACACRTAGRRKVEHKNESALCSAKLLGKTLHAGGEAAAVSLRSAAAWSLSFTRKRHCCGGAAVRRHTTLIRVRPHHCLACQPGVAPCRLEEGSIGDSLLSETPWCPRMLQH